MSALDFLAEGLTKNVNWGIKTDLDYTHTYHSYSSADDISGANIFNNARDNCFLVNLYIYILIYIYISI